MVTPRRPSRPASSASSEEKEEDVKKKNGSPPPAPLPGEPESDSPADLERMGEMPMSDLVPLIQSYGLSAHDGHDREKLLVRFMRMGEKRGLNMVSGGQIEIMPDHFGFARSRRNSFLPAPSDIYIAADMVKEQSLRAGMIVRGTLKRGHRRDNYFAIDALQKVNDHPPEPVSSWTLFEDQTPVFPDQRILLEMPDEPDLSTRLIDLIAPIGFGQRGLIVSPPRAGKTMLLKSIARGVKANHPNVRLVVFLVDERPEEVTDIQRTIDGEVIYSTFDEPATRHVQVADRVFERVRSLTETGYDVVLLIDSITRLGRAHNSAARKGGRILTGGLESNALQRPKRLFSSARNLEGEGSLTILATALVETNSRMDEVIFEEFKGTGNMEIVLSRMISEQRIFPAIDITRSGTRNEELLFDPEEGRLVDTMRGALADLPPVESIEKLLAKMSRTNTNAEFLMSLTKDRW